MSIPKLSKLSTVGQLRRALEAFPDGYPLVQFVEGGYADEGLLVQIQQRVDEIRLGPEDEESGFWTQANPGKGRPALLVSEE